MSNDNTTITLPIKKAERDRIQLIAEKEHRKLYDQVRFILDKFANEYEAKSNLIAAKKAIEFINDHEHNKVQINYNDIINAISLNLLPCSSHGFSKLIQEDDLLAFAIEFGYLAPEANQAESAESVAA